jgi:hypothetical protein
MSADFGFKCLGVRRTEFEPEQAKLVTLAREHFKRDYEAHGQTADSMLGYIERADQIYRSTTDKRWLKAAGDTYAALSELREAQREVATGRKPVTDFPYVPLGINATNHATEFEHRL